MWLAGTSIQKREAFTLTKCYKNASILSGQHSSASCPREQRRVMMGHPHCRVLLGRHADLLTRLSTQAIVKPTVYQCGSYRARAPLKKQERDFP
jgi:hypothetical protein